MDHYRTTIGDALDRLEVKAGKIGMNSREQAYALLAGLDEVFRGMETIENEQSRKTAEAQLYGIVAKMESEARQMLRDLGGREALAAERARVRPPAEHSWWYLDERMARTRQMTLRRWLITGGVLLAVLAVLVVVYRVFLAPDPQVAERYRREQDAQALLMSGEYGQALQEIDQGLVVAPGDPTLTVLKGVVQELSGQAAAAQETYEQALGLFDQSEEFFVMRGQFYAGGNRAEKALADAQEALRLHPDMPEAHLLAGQAREILGQYQEALEDYDRAYESAEATERLDLAAMARLRRGMLMQMISGRPFPTAPVATTAP